MTFKGYVGNTFARHVEIQFDWKVENFFSLSEKANDFYESPTFQFLGHNFHLLLYPSCSHSDKSEGSIGLYLRQNEPCRPIEVECTLGIKSSEGNLEVWPTSTGKFHYEDKGFGTKWCLRSELLNRRQELALDAVTFTVSMKNVLCPMAGTTDVEVQTSLEDVDSHRGDTSRLPEKTGSMKVAEDIGKLWRNSENSDVILRVGDVEFEFRAHRAILSARTPVLRALLSRNSEEKEPDVVTITDCDPKIFDQFLNYIYTGSPRELTAKTAFGLYILAEKYLVGDLKTQCARYFRSALSVETFCDAVLLALTHGEVALLQETVDFAAQNMRLIIKSVEWQKFHVEHPTEANEILVKALCSHETGSDE